MSLAVTPTADLMASGLSKTEFFNDLLMKVGLDHGINFFLRENGRELAEVRIWRKKTQPDFDAREIGLLKVLSPFLGRALSTAPEAFELAECLQSESGRALHAVPESSGSAMFSPASALGDHFSCLCVRSWLQRSGRAALD